MTAHEPQKPSSTTPDPSSASPSVSSSAEARAAFGGTSANPEGADDGMRADDSPELLRWRADILLDEMMLGAVDTGGGRADASSSVSSDVSGEASGSTTTWNRTAPPASAPPVSAPRPYSDAAPAMRTGGDDFVRERPSTAKPVDQAAAPPYDRPPYDSRPPYDRTWRDDDESRGAVGAVETPVVSEHVAEHAPNSSFAHPYAPAAPTSGRGGSSADDALLRPPTAAAPYRGAASPAPAAGAFSRQDQQQRRRNNLLPRMSEADVAQLRQDITTLTNDVEVLLPAGHDWHTRSEHLLERADHILRTTPERSAEVEYYLHQVRAIIGRAAQTSTASQVYRTRLIVYHIAWLVLSVIGVVAVVLYIQPMTDRMAALFGFGPDSLLAGHAAAYVLTAATATLGAALGALVNMRRYRSQGRGFFDRKYSLRSLLLPVFALLVASILYIIAALIFWMMGIVPLQQPLYATLAAVPAFAYGFWQEHVYGTAP